MSVMNEKKTKTELRKALIEFRASMNKAEKFEIDLEIQSKLLVLHEYIKCDTVLVYVAKDIEVDTLAIICAAWASGKRVAAPRCRKDSPEMDFYYINSMEDLEVGAFGVREPRKECVKAENFNNALCIVPGLSFDADGYRLGYGKGYYDRFLVDFEGISVGLCYSKCMEFRLPYDEFDRKVNMLVTDTFVRTITKVE